ncbi:MAG TPA: S-layer homology domain-containing protein, partial [Bacilli bacterium]|nr:S-layer homology domain-containing protein [Bacilli bacterium]
MIRLRHRLASVFVVIAMILTLLPASVSFADAEYFRFMNFSTNVDDPTQVNTKVVDIVGTFNGVSANSITYQIEHIINGQVVETARGTGVAPLIENGNTFKFMRVELFSGLNKITIFGINPSGNQVPGTAYVNFSNVPVLYDLKLVDGRSLEVGKPLVVESPTAVILLKAPNADSVKVNDVMAYNAGEDSWIVSNLALHPGLNKLAIVASNDTMTYALNREVVYFNGYPTAYSTAVVNASGDPTSVSLEGNPTVGPNVGTSLTGRITGNIVYQTDNSNPPDPTISLELFEGTSSVPITFATTVTRVEADPGYTIFSYTANTDLNLTSNNPYTLRVVGDYGTQSASYPVTFSYRNANTAYITDLNQLYNVRELDPTTVVYDSSTVLNNNSMIFELPIWLEADIENAFDINNVTLTSVQNGTGVPAGSFNYDKYLTDDGNVAFKILSMPAGEQTLTVKVSSAGGDEIKSVKLNYVPAPFIQLSNIYNTKVFNANGNYPADEADSKKFTTLKGRLVNFNNIGGTDKQTVTVTINGKTVKLVDHLAPATTIDSSGRFTFVVPSDMKLVNGPNNIKIAGTGNGVPVTTEMTVYMFSDLVPVISNIYPVPYDPLSPQVQDINLKFKEDGPYSYVTNERRADILFTVENVDEVVVNVDGVQNVTATNDSTGTLVSSNAALLKIDSYDPMSRRYTLRIPNHMLPETGVRSIVVQAHLGSATVSQTLTITREISPYMILSPLLPNEHVINQNFLDIAIQAEGADQVLIGKEAARKEADDIFRYEMRDMKVGINKIKFTVVRGTQTIPGEFEVNYAGTSTLGAQYKSTIPKNGKIKVFGGDVVLELPKGTLLKKNNPQPGQESPTVDLFDVQQVLFGIADRNDGRTVKKVNVDGVITDIPARDIASNLLNEPAHFGYASQLYWIDAGYFDGSTLNQYNTVDGKHPYATGSEFYLRTTSKWMEPSSRGEITLTYDPYIRDGAAVNLSVWKFANNNWENVGGVVDVRKHQITAAFDGFGYYAVMNQAYSFNDVVGHPYARNSLETMFSKGIMRPKDNNEFGVYENITRGEFATMMVKALDIPLEYDASNMTFDDVPNVAVPGALWDYRYIETAVKKGIIRGIGPRVFAPNASLTREQAATMIARALNLKEGIDTDKDLASLQKLFTDANTVNYYAIPAVLAVAKSDIIVGRPNVMQQGQKKPTYRFDPLSYL